MKRALLGLIVIGLLPGCGSAVALLDTQDAMEKTDAVNLENWLKVRKAQMDFLAGERGKLLANARTQIDAAPDGPNAAKVFDSFLVVNRALSDREALVAKEYGEAIDNAYLQGELRARQRQIISGWYGLLKLIPGVETLRAVAEAKARAYVEKAGD